MSALAHETIVDTPPSPSGPSPSEVADGLRLLGIDLADTNAHYKGYALSEAYLIGYQAGAAQAGRNRRLVVEREQRDAAASVLHALTCDRCGGDDLTCPDIKGKFYLLGNAAVNAARTVTPD